MVDRVNGGIRQGVWVEQEVRFVRLDFDDSLDAIGAGNAFTSDFGTPNSILEHAIETVAGRATVLGVSAVTDSVADSSSSYIVMLGHAQGHGSAANDGVILNNVAVAGVDSNGDAVTANVTATFCLFQDLPIVATTDMSEDVDGLFRPTVTYGHPYE